MGFAKVKVVASRWGNAGGRVALWLLFTTSARTNRSALQQLHPEQVKLISSREYLSLFSSPPRLRLFLGVSAGPLLVVRADETHHTWTAASLMLGRTSPSAFLPVLLSMFVSINGHTQQGGTLTSKRSEAA